MKKVLLLCVAIIALAAVDVSAQSQKKMMGKAVDVPGTKKIGKTEADKKFFRGYGNAKGSTERSAKMKAEMEAKRLITEQVKVTVKTASESYMKEVEVGDAVDFQSSMENMTITAANNVLSGAVPAGYELFYLKKEDKYNAYVMYELDKEEMQNSLTNQISKDEKLRVEFDKEKFRKNFESEMDKFSDGQ